MKKLLNTFWSSPVIVIFFLLLSYAIALTFYRHNLTVYTQNWGIVDTTTYCCYVLLFAALFFYRGDYKTKAEKNIWHIFCFFALAAFLREAGIQHWLTFTDSTAFKLRFFTNPDNPLFEKIIAFFCLASVSGLFIYTMLLYLIPSFKGFFLKMPGSWTIITLLSAGALCKIIDRLPANLKKSGLILEKDGFIFGICQIAEETLEMTLPVLAVIALSQFHQNKKLFFPHKAKNSLEEQNFQTKKVILCQTRWF